MITTIALVSINEIENAWAYIRSIDDENVETDLIFTVGYYLVKMCGLIVAELIMPLKDSPPS
jgi:hypothetical protein